MKIRVKHDFKDRENNLKLRTVGEIMTGVLFFCPKA